MGTAPALASPGISSRSGPRRMATAATATAPRPADTAGVTLAATSADTAGVTLAATSAATAGEAGSLAATVTERFGLLAEPRTTQPAAGNVKPAAQ
jgi:hypothetical protein